MGVSSSLKAAIFVASLSDASKHIPTVLQTSTELLFAWGDTDKIDEGKHARDEDQNRRQ
jgi:hypothetical protein